MCSFGVIEYEIRAEVARLFVAYGLVDGFSAIPVRSLFVESAVPADLDVLPATRAFRGPEDFEIRIESIPAEKTKLHAVIIQTISYSFNICMNAHGYSLLLRIPAIHCIHLLQTAKTDSM
jgi:hypothetical protein